MASNETWKFVVFVHSLLQTNNHVEKKEKTNQLFHRKWAANLILAFFNLYPLILIGLTLSWVSSWPCQLRILATLEKIEIKTLSTLAAYRNGPETF